MRAFFAFFKKEMREAWRSGRLLLLGLLFLVFGIMNPAIAKLTPWLMETLSESLEASGMNVTVSTATVMDSWTQFFKNVPMALIVFVVLISDSFSSEYRKGTLIPLLTKGLARRSVVLAKALRMLVLWTAGYWLCFLVTCVGNGIFGEQASVSGLWASAGYWYLFGVMTVSLCVLFSVLFRSMIGVLLGVGGTVMSFYLLSLIPKLTTLMPTSLMNGMSILLGTEPAGEYTVAAILTAGLCALCVAVSIPLMDRKQL